MNLRRIKKLAGLTESISQNPTVNQEIDKILTTVDPQWHKFYLDVAEILHSAGPMGASIRKIVDDLRQLYPDIPFKTTADSLIENLKNAINAFPYIIKLDQNTYSWDESAHNPDVDPSIQRMVGMSNQITRKAIEILQANSELTKSNWIEKLSNAFPRLPAQHPQGFSTEGFIDRLISQLPDSIVPGTAPNTYKYSDNTTPVDFKSWLSPDSLKKFKDEEQ